MSLKIPQNQTRFTVYAEYRDGSQEIGIGINLDQQIDFAKNYNSRTGAKTWIRNTTNHEIVFALTRRTPRAQGAGGGQ